MAASVTQGAWSDSRVSRSKEIGPESGEQRGGRRVGGRAAAGGAEVPPGGPGPRPCARLDRLQRRMFATVLRPPRQPHEEASQFFRLRVREVGALARFQGMWGERQYRRADDWLANLERHSEGPCWPALLLRWRGFEWLLHRRVALWGAPQAAAPTLGQPLALLARDGRKPSANALAAAQAPAPGAAAVPHGMSIVVRAAAWWAEESCQSLPPA